jgi:hypothetical protein
MPDITGNPNFSDRDFEYLITRIRRFNKKVQNYHDFLRGYRKVNTTSLEHYERRLGNYKWFLQQFYRLLRERDELYVATSQLPKKYKNKLQTEGISLNLPAEPPRPFPPPIRRNESFFDWNKKVRKIEESPIKPEPFLHAAYRRLPPEKTVDLKTILARVPVPNWKKLIVGGTIGLGLAEMIYYLANKFRKQPQEESIQEPISNGNTNLDIFDNTRHENKELETVRLVMPQIGSTTSYIPPAVPYVIS